MGNRSTKLAAGVAACAGIALTVAVIDVTRTANRRWAEMNGWIETTRQELEATDYRRTALHGASTEGVAFDHYEEALRIAASLRNDEPLLTDIRLRPHEVELDEVAALLARWEPAITAMRAGAHCADARPDLSFDPDAEPITLVDARSLANVAVLQARELLAAGRSREAVELTLDAAMFGADHLRAPAVIEQMIGLALVAIATAEAWTGERLALLDSPALETLATGLDRLDLYVPAALPLEGEALATALFFRDPPPSSPYAFGRWESRGFGFSTRWMTADAVLDIASRLARRRDTDGAGWTQRERELAALDRAAATSPNPIVQLSAPNLVGLEENHRTALAMLRVLRIDVETRLGRQPPQLDDPLGDGRLEITESPAGRSVASAGYRGRNPLLMRTIGAASPR